MSQAVLSAFHNHNGLGEELRSHVRAIWGPVGNLPGTPDAKSLVAETDGLPRLVTRHNDAVGMLGEDLKRLLALGPAEQKQQIPALAGDFSNLVFPPLRELLALLAQAETHAAAFPEVLTPVLAMRSVMNEVVQSARGLNEQLAELAKQIQQQQELEAAAPSGTYPAARLPEKLQELLGERGFQGGWLVVDSHGGYTMVEKLEGYGSGTSMAGKPVMTFAATDIRSYNESQISFVESRVVSAAVAYGISPTPGIETGPGIGQDGPQSLGLNSLSDGPYR